MDTIVTAYAVGLKGGMTARLLKAIADTEGVDVVFFGPADLAASMGHRGHPSHPDVQRVILDGITAVRAAGKAPGILAADPVLAQRYLDAGALFVAVGLDTSLLTTAATELAGRFKGVIPQVSSQRS